MTFKDYCDSEKINYTLQEAEKFCPGITPKDGELDFIYYIYYIQKSDKKVESVISFHKTIRELDDEIDTISLKPGVIKMNIGMCSKSDKNTLKNKLDKLPQFKQYLGAPISEALKPSTIANCKITDKLNRYNRM